MQGIKWGSCAGHDIGTQNYMQYFLFTFFHFAIQHLPGDKGLCTEDAIPACAKRMLVCYLSDPIWPTKHSAEPEVYPWCDRSISGDWGNFKSRPLHVFLWYQSLIFQHTVQLQYCIHNRVGSPWFQNTVQGAESGAAQIFLTMTCSCDPMSKIMLWHETPTHGNFHPQRWCYIPCGQTLPRGKTTTQILWHWLVLIRDTGTQILEQNSSNLKEENPSAFWLDSH